MKRSDWIRIGIGLVLLIVAGWALMSQLRNVELRDVLFHVKQLPNSRLLAAALLVAANYLQMSLYDAAGLSYLGVSLPYRRIALTSFIATAFGHNVGPSVASAGSVRYRFYSEDGLTARQIARLIAFLAFTFTVGFAVVGGMTLAFVPGKVDIPALPPGLLRGIGITLLALAAVYALLVVLARKVHSLQRLQLPTPGVALAQLFVSGVDWLVMAAILKLLLPADSVSYFELLRVLFVAQFAGMISQVPGGLGVFESLMVAALTAKLSPEAILSTLLLYRLLYFFGPLVLAAGLLVFSELRSRARARLRQIEPDFRPLGGARRSELH